MPTNGRASFLNFPTALHAAADSVRNPIRRARVSSRRADPPVGASPRCPSGRRASAHRATRDGGGDRGGAGGDRDRVATRASSTGTATSPPARARGVALAPAQLLLAPLEVRLPLRQQLAVLPLVEAREKRRFIVRRDGPARPPGLREAGTGLPRSGGPDRRPAGPPGDEPDDRADRENRRMSSTQTTLGRSRTVVQSAP